MSYTPYGPEWEREMNNLTKKDLIKMIRTIQVGSEDRKLVAVETMRDAQTHVEGIVNDFESGIIDKQEAVQMFGQYTNRLMVIFWENAKKQLKTK